MDNLLTLIRIEQVRELKIRAGVPPIVMSENESHMLEGPPLTTEGAEQLLRSIREYAPDESAPAKRGRRVYVSFREEIAFSDSRENQRWECGVYGGVKGRPV